MAEKLEVDVLVVGAGPAGSTAAEFAALGGAEVLVIEKRPIIGVPVRCGEFMPQIDEIKGIFPDAKMLDQLFDMPSSLKSVETDTLRIFSPKLRRSEIPFHGYTTFRDKFDQHLAAKAMSAGARFLTGEPCIKLEGNRVMTPDLQIEAKTIVGADGPLSLIAKTLKFERSWDLCPALVTEATGDFEPVPEMYFGNISPGGYAWVIPKKHGANVGLGVSRRYVKGDLRSYWKPFVEYRRLEVGKLSGKMVPMSGPISKTVEGDCLVVGDAAGQVMAVNGGGIPIAMICGRIAGQVAARHALNGMDLMEYERGWRKQVGGPLRTAVRTKRLAMMAFGSQWRLEWAMRFMGDQGMGKAIRCQRLFL
jgi:digeranylgeranylglycerophospholipid reductase